MPCLHLVMCNCAADLLHFLDVIYGVHLLHMYGFDVLQPKRIQAFARELCVITGISEELWNVGNSLADDILYLAIEYVAREAATEDTAEKVLLMQSCRHQSGGNVTCIVDKVHLAWT